MDKVVIVVFDDEKLAYEGSRAFHGLHKEGSITLYVDAVIAKDPDGTVSLRRAPVTGPAGALFGLLTGTLVGMLGGPVGAAARTRSGALAGAAFDLTRADLGGEFLGEVSERLRPGTAAVITEIDEVWQAPVDVRMEALGGRVFRRNRIEVEDVYYEKEVMAYRSEVDALEAELSKAPADRKTRLEARIKETLRKLQEKEDQLEVRIESIRREGEAKMESLQQQLATARDERKARLEKRLAEIRASYRGRAEKLSQAWELTKTALTV